MYYDIFISHNNAEKEWASALADRLADVQYNGRTLRPWLDRQYLDPGNLATNAELTTALDRSRTLGLVVSPAAVASEWVQFELSYFLEQRADADVVVMLRRACELPKALEGLPVLDFRSDSEFPERFGELVTALCPATEIGVDDVNRHVHVAIDAHLQSDPGGFWAGPTKERDDVFRALVQYDIDDAAFEGLALAAFECAAEHVLQLHASRDDRTYNTKMLLGECLAAAIVRSVGYRQVARRFLDLAATQADGEVLRFVIARAFSKLAEIDSRLVDTSVLVRLSRQLDEQGIVSPERKAVESLLGRTLGKLRGTPAGDLLIKTLMQGGRSSRISAIGSIALTYHRSGPVFYISELERVHERRDTEEELHRDPPSKRMLALLFASDLGQHADVEAALRIAKDDLKRDFPGTDLPYGSSWPGLSPGIAVSGTHDAPFMGTVVKVTLNNMIEVAGSNNTVSTVACLTEPRIIEALFQNCGALLIPQQDADSHQCRRLRGRSVPFAMLSDETAALLADGDAIVVDQDEITIWSRARAPDWPTPTKRRRVRPKTVEPDPATLPAIPGTAELMRERIQPHLEAMAPHIHRPMRLGIRFKSEGHKPSEWVVDFEPGAMRVDEREPSALNVWLYIDVEGYAALLGRELTSNNVMRQVWGDVGYFSTLFDAWNAAVRRRRGD